ncbi:hypothetical protein [uncultured Campylobacter sp.]|uniref:hypothetical protein n=1 Tax=uncultured Campylobacter sp. TaxID=218934 RepID=UPI00260A27CF|nr:hypothetical protein [uncultured Campylobacter sp.]
MNARSFLGDEKISALMQRGYSPEQITNYAKTEYYKQQGAQQASLTPQQETQAASQQNVVLRPAPQQSENTDWAAQGYRPVPIRDEQTGEVVNSAPKLGLDGRPIPAAPTPGRSEEARANDKKSKFLGGALDGLGMEVKTILANSFFGSGEPAKSKDEILRDKVAKASSRSLFQTIAGDEKDAAELQKDLDYIAKNAGYELGAVQTSDGKIYFGTRGANGQIIQKEVTPSLWDDLAARKTEIAGGVVGAGLAPFTGGASLVPMLAMSAGGSAIGSMNDLRQKGEAVGREYSAGDYASRALQAAGEDALGGAAAIGVGKLVKAAAPAIKQAGEKIISPVVKKAASLADNSILANLARRATTDNIEGAEAQYIKSMGGEAQALKDLAATKNALGEEGFSQFSNADRSFQIPKTGSESIDKGIGFANEKIIKPAEQTIKRVIQGENLSQREADLLASALSNDKGAKLVLDSVASDANAFAKTQKVMQGLNSSFAKNIGEAFKDAPNAVQTLKEYAARTKGDFSNVIKTLDNEFSTAGLDTRALSKNVSAALQDTLGNSRTTKHIMKAIERGGLDGLQDARSFINKEMSAMKGANDALSRERILELGDARAIIDDAVNGALDQFSRINPRVGERAKALMETARNDYRAFKEVQESDLYKRLTGAMKDTNDLTSALIKSADNQTGKNLDEILSVLNPAERANIEGSLLKNIVERNTKNGITDFEKAFEQIDKIPFKSQRVAGAVEELKQSAPLLKNSGEILKQLSEMAPKTAELQQGIGKTIAAAFQVMLRNRVVNKLKSKIPWYGNNQALKNHIANALKNAGDLEGAIKNIEAIPTEGLDSATKEGLSKFVKEVVPEIRQIIKTQNDDAVRAKFSPEELKKALTDSSLTTQEKVNLVERAKQQIKEELDQKAGKVAKGELVKQGEGFAVKDGGKPYQYAQQTFKPEQWINDLSGILTDKWAANLKSLAVKHPEMFKSEADVFRVIKEIKNNPTRFFKNNNSENALILKDLSETKTGEVGIRKTDGQIIHATTNDKEKRLNQLNKRQNKILGNTQLESSDRSARLSRHSDTSRTMATADNAGSVANDPIIPQNSQKVKELSPAELRKAIINAKDDKERLAIIENQKAGIRQRLEDEAVGDKSADKLAKEAQILADNKPAEKKFTLETIKSFDHRKHGHAYLSKISFNDRKPVREFIDSNTRMWDSKRKYYETSYTFNAKEGDMFEARLDDGSWKSDLRDYYIVKKDDKGELYLSRAKELSYLQKEAIKEAETKSEWETKILSSANVEKLNKIMRDIEHTEVITPNNRAKLYVAITNRLKELREARK